MEMIPVVVKHQGKRYDVELDTSTNGEVLKLQLYSLTGVEPDRQKILVKGGQLKDSTNLSTLSLKPGHVFMMMGTPSPDGGSLSAIQPPKEKPRFIEDMSEAEAARAEGAIPAGLQNLGNTCYLNSTLQTLRAVPELQHELMKYQGPPAAADGRAFWEQSLESPFDLTKALRDLYKQMSETQEGFPPIVFLNGLRSVFPQFAQKVEQGLGYAQQDAEEAWSQIVSVLRQNLRTGQQPAGADASSGSERKSFVDKYLVGKFETVTECDDVAAKEAGEEPLQSEEAFLKLDCHIGMQTNHLRDGILAALEEKIDKRSSTLDRDTIYTKRFRIARLPKYLTVHFVRFYWKREIRKKAKILRKVSFQQELDAVEFCTDELKQALIPIRDKIRDVRKEELEIERAKKRRKTTDGGDGPDATPAPQGTGPPSTAQGAESRPTNAGARSAADKKSKNGGDVDMPDVKFKTDAEVEAEQAASILQAKKEVLELVGPKLKADDGGNKTGLYELRAVIAHQGASADSGHYTAYVKKDATIEPSAGAKTEAEGKWWWFNDEKVSEVDNEKIEGLSGGGESHSALILLYRAVPLPELEASSSSS